MSEKPTIGSHAEVLAEAAKIPGFAEAYEALGPTHEVIRRLANALADAETRLGFARAALIAHRADLHQGSNRPCATCRNSAKVLGIDRFVPDHCASAETDREALRKASEAPHA